MIIFNCPAHATLLRTNQLITAWGLEQGQYIGARVTLDNVTLHCCRRGNGFNGFNGGMDPAGFSRGGRDVVGASYVADWHIIKLQQTSLKAYWNFQPRAIRQVDQQMFRRVAIHG